MNKKLNKQDVEEMFRMFDDRKKGIEIASHFGISPKQVSMYKKKYDNASFESKKEVAEVKQEVSTSNETKIQKVGDMIKRWSKPVLIAIYKIDSYQSLYLKEKKMKFDLDCDVKYKIIFKMFESIYKKHGYLPNEDIMVYEFNSLINSFLAEETECDYVDVEDEFNAIIYDISYDKKFLSEIVDKYNGYITILDLLSVSLDMCKNNADYHTLKNKFDEVYNTLSLPADNRNAIISMDSDIKPMASKMYPFFVNEINKATRGLPTGVNILCGLTGSGKTMACVNQEVFLAKQKIPSLHFVLGDLTADEYQSRILAHLSQTDCWTIITNENLKEKLKAEYKDVLKYIKISVITEGMTVDGFINKIRKYRTLCAEKNMPIPSFIVFDYDDLIDTKSGDEWKRAEEIYKPLQTFGMDNFCSILCVAQPNKQAEATIRNGDREMELTDISGGRKKANIAAVAIGFSVHKADPEKEKGFRTVTVKVMKGRNGGIGTKKQLLFDGNKCTYHQDLSNLTNDKIAEAEEWIGNLK